MARKKKIAFYGIKYFPSKGGTSRVAENLIANLKSDFDITIYCYKNSLAKSYMNGVSVIELPEINMGSLGVFLYYALCTFHIIFRSNYDVIHAHKIDSFFFLSMLASKAKVIATAHEAPYKRDKWGMVARLYFRFNEERFLNFKGIKTSISKPLAAFYKLKYNVDVHYIPNGINLYSIKNSSMIEKYWPEKLPKESPYILFAARRIMGTKGLHTMLEAYKKLNYQGNIFIAGELDNYPKYIDKVMELSKGLNVFYIGFVQSLDVLLELVNKCEYFVFPSETEGMSIMLLEVASTGKPIIASDIPENTEVFNEQEVLYFKNKEVDDLVNKIVWAENNTNGFSDIGKNAKDKVTKKYTWNKIALEYKGLYENS